MGTLKRGCYLERFYFVNEYSKLTELLNGKLFYIPDYQRGYAWNKKEINDLINDIDDLVTDKNINSHYTGTIVTYRRKEKPVGYNHQEASNFDIVDGQQRLTSILLYLSVIIRALSEKGKKEFENHIPAFLYHSGVCKLNLANETGDLFIQLLKEGKPRNNNEMNSPHQKRLIHATETFSKHIQKQPPSCGKGNEYLQKLFKKITSNLFFTCYIIQEECEIGMTFELMNSRGRGLSVFELLKNYFLHWIYRNIKKEKDRENTTQEVNQAWKDIYSNIGNSTGNEEQCLRIAWIIYCSHLPKDWEGYEGFKSRDYVPIKDFSKKKIPEVREFLLKFINGVAEISRHYSIIISPTENGNKMDNDEKIWLTKINNAGNIANFLPLMVIAREFWKDEQIEKETYIELLKTLECYVYRVFLFEEKRSNAGKAKFFSWGHKLFHKEIELENIIPEIHELTGYYSDEKDFKEYLDKPDNWYASRRCLKYTLFEYEISLLRSEESRIKWSDLGDASIEHILPQQPKENGTWKKNWNEEDINQYLHDLGNLVLTHNNSVYGNSDFERKKGKIGDEKPCYSKSNIRQEQEVAAYPKWTKEQVEARREKIVKWIKERWKTEKTGTTTISINEEEDEEAL